ncbi:hypothetical protein [Marinomonas ostreistagni]|uniref:Outer membrane protein beta-barrel domain-containing protein n=1 Tax=Marinomonas ostreistagni TaxID=359209 RepID=A0ABS0ZAC9_9GAMM|nr:hypothetical protein [Marinomonas ostreistagni]MBJ7550615.1 hypothetical protein [Marinomonas ostreistagni]
MMKYLYSLALLGFSFAPWVHAEGELPNFELGLGGGIAKTEPAFNIDLTVNIPISKRWSSQINLDSDYIFNDTNYEDYSMSEFNAIGFYRHDNWRAGAGMGLLEKKSRDDSFPTERVGIARFLASYYWQDITLDWQYANYNDDFDRAVSMELGALWYLDDIRKVALYAEDQVRGTGWRLEAFIQPEKRRNQLAYGAILRNGKGDSYPYVGFEMRYYFDRTMPIKQRDRLYH